MQIGVHIVVKGMVQGVGYRFFVYRQAMKLGVTGWVRNSFSGDVEIEAEGDRSMVEELITEVKIGPRSAHVKDLIIEWQEYKSLHQTFEIR
jgi:acylphosphatase